IGFLAAAGVVATTGDALKAILWPALGSAAGWVSLLVVTLLVALVTAIFGELVPKALGLAHAEPYAILFARPVEILGRVFAPVVGLLERVTNGITGALGVSGADRD